MTEPSAEHTETQAAPAPTNPAAMDPEKRKKLTLLLVVGGTILIFVLIGNLASRKRQQAARSMPQPVTISHAETKNASEMLPLVTIGSQAKGGQGLGPSDQDIEFERLTKELKVLQARTVPLHLHLLYRQARLDVHRLTPPGRPRTRPSRKSPKLNPRTAPSPSS